MDARRRKIALKAVQCFMFAEDLEQAAKVLAAIGEQERADKLIRRFAPAVDPARDGGQDPDTLVANPLDQTLAAARLAQRRNDHGQAAELFARAKRPFEAALSHSAIGDLRKCLAHVVRVPREHPRYREACVLAVNAASRMEQLPFQLQVFLADFVAAGPRDATELDAFHALGRLCEQNDLPVDAANCYRKLLVQNAAYRDVAQRLAGVEKKVRASSEGHKVFRSEDSGLHHVLRPGRMKPCSPASSRRSRCRGGSTTATSSGSTTSAPTATTSTSRWSC